MKAFLKNFYVFFTMFVIKNDVFNEKNAVLLGNSVGWGKSEQHTQACQEKLKMISVTARENS